MLKTYKNCRSSYLNIEMGMILVADAASSSAFLKFSILYLKSIGAIISPLT